MAQWGDCKKSQIAPLNMIIIIITIIIIINIIRMQSPLQEVWLI